MFCYKEDMKEINYDKKVVYKRYYDIDLLGSGTESINFNFVLKLNSGRNKIIFESNEAMNRFFY